MTCHRPTVQPLESQVSSLSDNDDGMVRPSRRPALRSVLTTAIVVSLLAVGLLWTQFGFKTHGGSCLLAPASGRLEARGFATYLIGTGGLGTPIDVAVSWPPGYSAVPDGSGELSVRDASGREVARTGTEVSLIGGDTGGEWQVCEVRSRS